MKSELLCRHVSEKQSPPSGSALQRAAVNEAPVTDVPPIVHEVLQSAGQPLDKETRDFFEPRFGHDFSRVRVHTDARVAEPARALPYGVCAKLTVSTIDDPMEQEADSVAKRVMGTEPEAHLNTLQGKGTPLVGSSLNSMEPQLGHQFSDVRIHTGEKASKAAKAVGARAFTRGREIVFADGDYAPGKELGNRLLAHWPTYCSSARLRVSLRL